MIERRAGVSTLLKHQNPNLLSVHCICHRLALAASQAAAEITYVKKILTSNSAVGSSGLKEVQSLLRDSVLKVKQARPMHEL